MQETSPSCPPNTYLLERDGQSARVFLLPAVESTPAPPAEQPYRSLDPLRLLRKSQDATGYLPLEDTRVPAFYIHSEGGRSYALYDGEDARNETRKLMDIRPESSEIAPSAPPVHVAHITLELFDATSTYTEVQGAKRETTMYKAKGPGGNPWYSL